MGPYLQPVNFFGGHLVDAALMQPTVDSEIILQVPEPVKKPLLSATSPEKVD